MRKKISKLLESKTRICNNPFYLFQELLSYSDEHKLMLLGYSTLQDLIGNAITQEEKRLGHLLEKYSKYRNSDKYKKNIDILDDLYEKTSAKRLKLEDSKKQSFAGFEFDI